jgi:signal transduction histidine kinase
MDIYFSKLYNVSFVYNRIYMQQTETIVFIIIANVLLLVFIVGIILFILQYKKRKVAHEKEKDMITEAHAKELLSTQLEMQTQTMQHIGREIHDNVGQKLTLASLYTQQLAFENKAPQINDKIENIGFIINESLAELRQLSKSLTDDRINDNNIIQLLQQECNTVNDLKKCEVTFSSNQHKIALPYQTKSILLRIAQEFLQNSIKHAACKTIKVNIAKEATCITLSLQDDGKGFDVNTCFGSSPHQGVGGATNNGIGLSNMKKRTEIIGGKFNLDSLPNKGTTLTIEIPSDKY